MGTHQDQDSLVLALPLLLRVRKLLPAERKEEEEGEERGEWGCMIVLKYSLTTINVKLDQKLKKNDISTPKGCGSQSFMGISPINRNRNYSVWKNIANILKLITLACIARELL